MKMVLMISTALKGVLKNGKNEIIDEEDIFFKYGYAYTQ